MAYSDSALIANDTALQGRVTGSIFAACHNVQTEAITQTSQQLHDARARLAAQILMAFASGTGNNWVQAFTRVVSVNATAVSAATTQAGGSLTAGNEAAACAAIPDSDIDNAIAASWNDFLVLIS